MNLLAFLSNALLQGFGLLVAGSFVAVFLFGYEPPEPTSTTYQIIKPMLVTVK